ncbi:MAG: poly-gamma-glutamate synthase PgsB [Deltaproteobacteria bacterium]|nr:MAG: poly-gamma-glutamate synthase PgsB [Deltaproteobacteria bacterium]
MYTLVVLLVLLIGYGSWEYCSHRSNLKKIPIRIHVNGTRGKSSVTRLIAAGLRANGISTVAKTTGSAPRVILEDGTEMTVQRQGRANIIEQVRTIALAARRGAKAVVLECMALQPKLQYLCEHKLIRSTVGVITNARADHLDVMGPTVIDVAKALAGTVPEGTVLVTSENSKEQLGIFRQACEQNRSRLVLADPAEIGITDDIMRGFSYVEHPENVALAMLACELAGCDRKKALDGMYGAEPDIGALRVLKLAFFAKNIIFVNALAANDPESTALVYERVCSLYGDVEKKVVILNCRADRPHRSVHLGQLLGRLEGLDAVMLTGMGTKLAMESALKAGCPPQLLVQLEGEPPPVVFERTLAACGSSGLVFAMGNIGSGGAAIAEYFGNRAVPSPEA